MKRASEDTESLVYAYGCRFPVSGLHEALAEAERCRKMWDRLVGVDRMAERCAIDSAREALPEFDDVARVIDSTDAKLRELLDARSKERQKARAKEKESDPRIGALSQELKTLRKRYWELFKVWRLANQERVKWIESERKRMIIEARQTSGMYWGNYNRIIDDYDRSRKLCRTMRRRLQESDPNQESGCLTVQIQRTISGLGAAPSELYEGKYAQLQIGAVPVAAHDPETSRGERGRLCRTIVEMRVDAEGHMVRLPMSLHRPLPTDCRIKRAQLTWRDRNRWQLALTISRPRQKVKSKAPELACGIDLGWRLFGPDSRSLRVAVIAGSDKSVRGFALSSKWMAGIDRVEELHSRIDLYKLNIHDTRERPVRELKGLRRRLLGNRREQYRLLAVELATKYRFIAIDGMSLAEAAKREGNDLPEAARAMRQRAALSEFIRELEHQCVKRGATLFKVDGPSTVTCHACGEHTEPPERADIFWRCGSCDRLWDQDENAAKNLLAFAMLHSDGRKPSEEKTGLRITRASALLSGD